MNRKSLNEKNGFTLAETLIVWVILGIIFVLTISIIIKKMPDKKALNWQKAYTSVGQIIEGMTSDEQTFPREYYCLGIAGETGRCYSYTVEGKYAQVTVSGTERTERCDSTTYSCSPTYIDCCNTSVSSVFKLITSSDSGTRSVNGPYFCTKFSEALNIKGSVDCTYSDTYKTNFTTNEGISFMGLQRGFDNSNEFITICVDVNGAEAPNKGCTSDFNAKDKDQFRMQIGYQGHIGVGILANMYTTSDLKNLSPTVYTYSKATCDPTKNILGNNEANNYCMEIWSLSNVYKE